MVFARPINQGDTNPPRFATLLMKPIATATVAGVRIRGGNCQNSEIAAPIAPRVNARRAVVT